MEGRNRKFLITEISIVIICFFYLIFVHVYFNYTNLFNSSPIFILLALMLIIQGIEEKKKDKEAKKYYHEWLTASFVIICILVLLTGSIL